MDITNLFNGRMRNLSDEEKAYVLGWLASSITHKSNRIKLRTDKYNDIYLRYIKKVLSLNNPILYDDIISYIIIEENELDLNIFDVLSVSVHDIDMIINFPMFKYPELTWMFIQGCFDNIGIIKHENITTCEFISKSYELITGLQTFCEIPHEITEINYSKFKLLYHNTNCIDVLTKIYKNPIIKKCKYSTFVEILNTPIKQEIPYCYVYKNNTNAIIPDKTNASDVGYDLTVISKVKQWNDTVTLYDTGIKISIQYGYYADIVPRSSLSKSGYMLANSVGIIDPSYTGTICIALAKIDQAMPDLTLPFKCCQMIIRKQIHVDIKESFEDFDKTNRNAGGFGSTGK
jgi:deoxyuridine 5'-triphosphate nucleotidohydrolase